MFPNLSTCFQRKNKYGEEMMLHHVIIIVSKISHQFTPNVSAKMFPCFPRALVVKDAIFTVNASEVSCFVDYISRVPVAEKSLGKN
jgi:hypothetical protein